MTRSATRGARATWTASVRLLAAACGCAVFVYTAAQLARVQLATEHLTSRDGYYHARYAHLLPTRGLSREFAWTQHSLWRDRFADKDLLFHAYLAPFCTDERTMVARAKTAAWLLGVAVLGAFALAVRSTGIPLGPLWALVLFGAGSHFVFRLSQCRAHVLSIGLFIVGLSCLLRGRWRSVCVVGFVYAWSYAAPHLLVVVACVHAVAVWTHTGRLPWRAPAAAALGVVGGLVVHPYFPNDLRLWWVQNVVVLTHAWTGRGELTLGDEVQSTTLRSLVVTSTPLLVGLVLGSLLCVVAARAQRLSARTWSLLLVMYACFTLYGLSARFVEYFAPAAIWLLASVATDLVDAARLGEAWRARPRRVLTIGLVIAGVVAALQGRSLSASLEAVRATRRPALAEAARWTRANVPPGANVLHLNWGDFVQLFAFDPDHRYVVGLDPSFMHEVDPERFRYLEDVRHGRRPVVKEELRGRFDARVLVVSKEWPGQVRACEDALLDVLYEDDHAVVYALD